MLGAPWRTLTRPPIIPPLVFMGTAALLTLAAAQLAIAAPVLKTSAVTDCSLPGAAGRASARHQGSSPAVAQRFDSRGEFSGRAMSIAGRSSAISLPAESFVAQPLGDALVYTISTAGRSEVHLIDLASGCDALIARPAGVTRSAILDASGSAVYVHSVTFPGRSDAGVTRYALDGSPGQQVVPPLPDDARFGLTFGTQLGWSSEGSALFVQSCAIDACRTRLLDVASTGVVTFDADGQGPIVGVTPQHVVTFAECDGLPCAVLSIDRNNASISTVADEAWSATLVGNAVRITTAAGIVVVAE